MPFDFETPRFLGPININQASQSELMQIPKMTTTVASAILKQRQLVGGFKRMSELRQIAGVGAKRFAALTQYATVLLPLVPDVGWEPTFCVLDRLLIEDGQHECPCVLGSTHPPIS